MSIKLETSSDIVEASHQVTTSRLTFDATPRLMVFIGLIVILMRIDVWAYAILENLGG